MKAASTSVTSLALALALGASIAHGAPPPRWDATETLSFPSRIVGAAALAVDLKGDAVAVWSRNGVVEGVVRPASGDWTRPLDLGSATTMGRRGIQLAIAPATGEAVAAWEYRSGTPGTLIQVARLPSPSARWRSGATFASAPPGSIRPTLGFDDGGALTASWYWNGVVQTASRPALGTFSAARTLTAPGPGVDAPALAVGALGDAVVAWDRFADPVRTIESASRAPGGDWAPPERIAPVETAPNPGPYLSPPSVALDSSGRATALWGIAGAGDAFRILTADRPAGGPWSAPFLLEDARLINGPLRMAGNPAGGAVAAWPGRGPRGRSVVRVSARPAGGATWSAPVTLSSPAREAGQPSIALDRAGDAAVGWTERLATGGSIVRVALRVAGAGSWQAAQTIGGAERRPRGIEGFLTASLPGVAFGGRRLTAVWTECSLARGSRIQLFVERCAIRSTSRALPRGG